MNTDSTCQTWNPPHSEIGNGKRCRDCGRTSEEHDATPEPQKEHWLITDAKTVRDFPQFRISDSINCRFAGAVKTLAAIHDGATLKAEINALVAAHEEATKIAHKRQEGPGDGIADLEAITG